MSGLGKRHCFWGRKNKFITTEEEEEGVYLFVCISRGGDGSRVFVHNVLICLVIACVGDSTM